MEWVLHVAAVVLWIGGLMAAGLVRGPEQPGRPSTQRRIMTTMALPGMIVAVLAGLGRAFRLGPDVLGAGWFHLKLALVVVLIVLQVLVARGRLRGAWITPVAGTLAVAAIWLAHHKLP